MRTLPERFSYRFKRAVLGPPPVSSSPRKERLSKRTALGVLSSDRVSSSAYGPEQILIALVPAVGVAAFAMVLPVTGVVPLVPVLVTLAWPRSSRRTSPCSSPAAAARRWSSGSWTAAPRRNCRGASRGSPG